MIPKWHVTWHFCCQQFPVYFLTRVGVLGCSYPTKGLILKRKTKHFWPRHFLTCFLSTSEFYAAWFRIHQFFFTLQPNPWAEHPRIGLLIPATHMQARSESENASDILWWRSHGSPQRTWVPKLHGWKQASPWMRVELRGWKLIDHFLDGVPVTMSLTRMGQASSYEKEHGTTQWNHAIGQSAYENLTLAFAWHQKAKAIEKKAFGNLLPQS